MSDKFDDYKKLRESWLGSEDSLPDFGVWSSAWDACETRHKAKIEAFCGVIAHGDEKHREWLRETTCKHFGME